MPTAVPWLYYTIHGRQTLQCAQPSKALAKLLTALHKSVTISGRLQFSSGKLSMVIACQPLDKLQPVLQDSTMFSILAQQIMNLHSCIAIDNYKASFSPHLGGFNCLLLRP